MNVIRSYVRAVDDAAAVLTQVLGVNSVEEAFGRRRTPRSGRSGDVEFRFHGYGCVVSRRGTAVDFEFFPDRRLGGFDAWRLWLFARDRPAEFGEVPAQHLAIQPMLEELARRGVLVAPDTKIGSHLYFIAPPTIRG